MYPYATRMLPRAYVERAARLQAPDLGKDEKAAIAAGLANRDQLQLLLGDVPGAGGDGGGGGGV
jgi:hypothetical protein